MGITLATLAEATEQQVFDQVALHLLGQGRKSQCDVDGAIWCAYRGDDGTRCAAGCLMTDEEMWNHGIDPLVEWRCLHADRRVPRHHLALIVELQRIHDESPVVNWCRELRKLARNNHLSMAVLDNDVPV